MILAMGRIFDHFTHVENQPIRRRQAIRTKVMVRSCSMGQLLDLHARDQHHGWYWYILSCLLSVSKTSCWASRCPKGYLPSGSRQDHDNWSDAMKQMIADENPSVGVFWVNLRILHSCSMSSFLPVCASSLVFFSFCLLQFSSNLFRFFVCLSFSPVALSGANVS